MSTASVIGIKLKGANGADFDIVNGTEGVILTGGIERVELPEFKFIESKSARGAGRRVTGIDWGGSELVLPLTVADTWNSRPRGDFRTGAAWVALDRTFKGAAPSPMSITGVEVTVAGGNGMRRFEGRLSERENVTKAVVLPDIFGRADYELSLSPDNPFWVGTSVDYSFMYTSSSTDNYYGPSNIGPPFYISKGNALGSAVVTNPGEVEDWPTWVITGPAQATVGVGDHLTYVQGLSSGEQITINTAPYSMDVTDENGERAWGRISSFDFAPIPPGESSNISARIVGGGPGASITMKLAPKFLSWY